MLNKKLWEDYKVNNNKEAKDQLILENLELLKKIVGKIYYKYKQHIDYDDIYGYGILGLIDAIERFDYKKGLQFNTYANLRIYGKIIDEIRAYSWVPRGVYSRNKEYIEAKNQLQQIKGDNITDVQIANKLNLKMEDFYKFQNNSRIYKMTQFEVGRSCSENPEFAEPEVQLCEKEKVDELAQAIEHLEKRKRRIIELYYYSELKYAEISEILGISTPRISQIMKETLLELKEYMS